MKPFRAVSLFIVFVCAIAFVLALTVPQSAFAEDRKVKDQVQPVYPELAKSMRITGAVKLEVSIGASGAVKNAKVIGGHPVLADAALRAVKNWKYEPGPEETRTVTIEFKN